jgi:putative nucleotidyltransferase with HDIG domain
VRIVLSGFAELETVLRVVSVAHQFLSKPCDEAVLENVVTRACDLRAVLNEEALRRVVGSIDRLPTLPSVYAALIAAVAKEDVPTQEIAGILKRDAALCAKTLQVVNSAFFGLGRPIAKVEDAVVYLGYNTVKQIVLAVEVFQSCGIGRHAVIPLETLQAHAMQVGNVASGLVQDRGLKDDAYVAGLLHDIGRLVLVAKAPERMAAAVEMAQRQCVPLHVAEGQCLGVTHAEVGAYLLGLWGLPYPIVEAVANHHTPSRVKTTEFGVLAAVHVADGLIREEQATIRHDPSAAEARHLDLEFLQHVGVSARIPEWRELAGRLAELTPAAEGSEG